MNICLAQLDTVWHDAPANHAKLRTLLSANRPAPASWLVLPEMFPSGFSMSVPEIAETDAGPTESFLSLLAREFQISIIGGKVARNPDGRGLNQAIVFDSSGAIVTRYNKLHPFSFAGEDRHYAPGRSISLFSVGQFTASVFVCYDLRFPEAFRHAALRGANLFFVIANWPTPRVEHWITLLRARAIENQGYVVGVNRVGKDPHVSYPGRSIVVDPRGQILLDAGDRECIGSCDIPLSPLLEYRKTFPAINDVHRDLLGL